MLRKLHWKNVVIGILIIIRWAYSIFPETYVEALVNTNVDMPCEVLAKKDNSLIEFVFWYRGEGRTPLYTLDARDRTLATAVHTRNETYADRVQFHVANLKVPYLQMDQLRVGDTGFYYCRVDYQWSATEVSKVHLVVVVPPEKLIVRDDSRKLIRDIAGPYSEYTDVSLHCEAVKGFPAPAVTWWSENKLVEGFLSNDTDSVVNTLTIKNASKTDIFKTYHCKAQNTELVHPISRTIILDLFLYPKIVFITGQMETVSASRPVQMTCQSQGSRPPAKITWWLNGTFLSDHTETVRNNITTSTVRFNPIIRHHKSTLVCKAENPKIKSSYIQDIRLLNVTYIPQVSLQLIKEFPDRQPKEDDYVRLICEIDSNPPILKVGWLFNDHPLSHNKSHTDIINRNTLVFKRLSRQNAGRYRCYGINSEGRGMSSELTLNVSHAPVCKPNQQITYVANLHQTVSIRCEVEAVPSDVTFRWEFTNSVRKHYDLQHLARGLVSLAAYRPETPADYGTLFCWANNSVGHQQTSCFFTVIAPACMSESVKSNTSNARDESSHIWQYSIIATGAGVAACIAVATVCALYLKKLYHQKKHRVIRRMSEEEINIYNRVSYYSNEPKLQAEILHTIT